MNITIRPNGAFVCPRFSIIWKVLCVVSNWVVERVFFKERLQLKRCHPHAHELQGEFFKFSKGIGASDEESDGGGI